MMQSASTPESEGVFSLAAQPQLAENSRQGSERKNRAPAPSFPTFNSKTTQWGSWQSSSGTASGPTVYLYDGANLLEEVDNSGNVLARYTQSGLLDDPLSQLRSGTTSYYEQDGLDTVTSLSSSAGALANTYTYDSFGKLTASSGTITNPFQYTTREFDAETGLYFYRARYMDSSTGRFISEDPISFAGGVNFYPYVGNNPVIHIDPSGLDWYDWWKKGRKWGDRSKCFISYYACLSQLAETRQSLDQMTDDAVTNTSDAMGSQGGYSNQRLKCGLSQDENCKKALEQCIKLGLTNPFPPPWWLKDLMNWANSSPKPQPPQPAPKP